MSASQLHKTRTLWLCGVLHAFTHIYHVALFPLYLPLQKDLGLATIEAAYFGVYVWKAAVEAAGRGIETGEHAASLTAGSPGVLHGNRTYLLQDGDGQIKEGHSISAGLDYPGIGPEHAWLNDVGRVEYVPIMDHEALEAFQTLTRLEGIIPALEPSHALAEVIKRAPKMGKDEIILMNLSGRGDKDIFTVGKILGMGQ